MRYGIYPDDRKQGLFSRLILGKSFGVIDHGRSTRGNLCWISNGLPRRTAEMTARAMNEGNAEAEQIWSERQSARVYAQIAENKKALQRLYEITPVVYESPRLDTFKEALDAEALGYLRNAMIADAMVAAVSDHVRRGVRR